MLGLRSSSLLRNITAVASGAAAGQVVSFLFSPLITRIYSPEAFGLQGVFLSLIGILSPAVALRLPMAIVVAESDAEAGQLSLLSMAIAFLSSALLGLVLLVTGGRAFNLMGAEGLGLFIWFLPLALFCVALQDIADFSAARSGSFRRVGLVNVIQIFLMNLARVIGGLIAPIAAVLVTVTTFAPAVQAAMLRFGAEAAPRGRLTREKANLLLRRHRDFALYRAPNDLLNAASQAVPVITLAAFYSPASAGLYTLTRSVMSLPTNVIGTAVGNVLYARFAELARNGKPLMPLLRRATFGLMTLAPAIILFGWLSPKIFAWFFGDDWREAGYYAQWVALWVAASIASQPLVRIIPVIARQRVFLNFNLFFLAIRIVSVMVALMLSGDAILAVILYSISSAAMIAVLMLIFFQYVRMYDRKPAECGQQFK